MRLDYNYIEDVYIKKGYTFFDGDKPYNLNIFGIRCATDTNFFDDLICVAYRDQNLESIVEIFQGTTDPGKHWLKHPMNSDGTAILCEGQYRSTYKIDKHRGKYDALCQRLGKVTVFRDNDKDSKHDLDPETEQSGYYGINIHKSNPYIKYVDRYSAGCQVFRLDSHFNRLMFLAFKSAEIYGNSFTYSLFNKSDFSL
jgi:hypothetical protein